MSVDTNKETIHNTRSGARNLLLGLGPLSVAVSERYIDSTLNARHPIYRQRCRNTK